MYLFTDAQPVEFLYSTIPSLTCLRLRDASVICRITYFQFPIQSAFLQYIVQRNIGFNTQYRTSDVDENLGKFLSGAQRIDLK